METRQLAVALRQMHCYHWEPEMATFGGNLRSIRTIRRLSQDGLASLLDVSRSQVSNWENDRYGLPATATLIKVGKAMACSIEQLLAGTDQEYTTQRNTLALKFLREAALRTRVLVADRDGVIELAEDTKRLLSDEYTVRQLATHFADPEEIRQFFLGTPDDLFGLDDSLDESLRQLEELNDSIPATYEQKQLDVSIITDVSEYDRGVLAGATAVAKMEASGDVSGELLLLGSWRRLSDEGRGAVQELIERLAAMEEKSGSSPGSTQPTSASQKSRVAGSNMSHLLGQWQALPVAARKEFLVVITDVAEKEERKRRRDQKKKGKRTQPKANLHIGNDSQT